MNYYLGLDVGGTNIKCGVIDESGKIMFDERIFSFNAQSYADKDNIISNFIAIFKELTEQISDSEINIKAIGLAFPGPFDYENGISLIRGIGKYDSIYNINLTQEFRSKIREDEYLNSLMDKEFKIVFMHDIAAFAMGEIYFGKGIGYKRIIHLCIGTGAGSAFSVHESLVVSGDGVPENGWIYNTAFKDSIIDDYISARGLADIASKHFSEVQDGRELYNKAVKQDEAALDVFKQFGQNLYDAFTPFVKKFKADCIILGGEIVKSFKFFGGPILEFCTAEKVDIQLTHNTSKSTLLGLYHKIIQCDDKSSLVLTDGGWRKKVNSNYNKQPYVEVKGYESNHGWQGFESIVNEVLSAVQAQTGEKTIIAIDLYPGVRIEEIKQNIVDKLHADLEIYSDEDFFETNEYVTNKIKDYMTDDRVFGIMCHLNFKDFVNEQKLKEVKAKIEASRGLIVVYGVAAALFLKPDIHIYADMARWEIQQRYRSGEIANWKHDNFKDDALVKYKRGFFFEWRIADRYKKEKMDSFDYVLDTNIKNAPKMITGGAFVQGLKQAAKQPFRVVPFFDPGVWGGQWMKDICDLERNVENYAWCFDCVPEENSLLLKVGDTIVEIPSIDLVFKQPKELLGEKVHARFGTEFPIRFDFLDTMGGQNLSLQVHPLTEYIQEKFGMNYTQDESYYILDAGEDSCVYLGVKPDTTKEEFFSDLVKAQEGIMDFPAEKHVNKFKSKKHDHFLIPAGTTHCSGNDTMVLEISSTPYIFTFKLWDWGRLGLDGKPRPIHLEHGKAVLQFDRDTEWVKKNLINRVETITEGDGWKEERTGLHEREFIETRRHWFSTKVNHDTNDGVNVLNLVEGREALVESVDGKFEPFKVHYAETFIIPASVGKYSITPCGESEGQTIATIKAYVRT